MARYTGQDKKLDYLFSRTKTMEGATLSKNGKPGVVPTPTIEDAGKFLCADGTWAEAQAGDPCMELTQAEYDALPEAEKMNGTTYYITDGENPMDEIALGELSDVAINAPADGQILKYDSQNAEWVNAEMSAITDTEIDEIIV